ncbi:MAG: hypothetical protein QFB86_04425 [Patescibacteria group bacterium]|nr:hypothetical protein [Patescibacteria group bacterium]
MAAAEFGAQDISERQINGFYNDLENFAGRAALNGDRMPSDDEFGGGEFAELHPDISPPGLGGIALGGRFNREPALV